MTLSLPQGGNAALAQADPSARTLFVGQGATGRGTITLNDLRFLVLPSAHRPLQWPDAPHPSAPKLFALVVKWRANSA